MYGKNVNRQCASISMQHCTGFVCGLTSHVDYYRLRYQVTSRISRF